MKVPVHEIGLMLSMSFAFVPTLMDDTTQIMNTQKKPMELTLVKVASFKKVKGYDSNFNSSFATSLKHADSLAVLPWKRVVIREERVEISIDN